MFIATDRFTGGSVDVGEPVDPAAHQDRVHGRCRHRETIADLNRTQALFPAQVHDLAHDRHWGAVRLPIWPRGAVAHPRWPLRAIASGPLRCGLPRHVITLGRASRRPAVVDDEPRQPQPGTRGQSSVGMGSVGHEDLLVVERFLGSSTPHREVFTRLRPQIVSSHDLDQRLWASQLAPVGRSGLEPLGHDLRNCSTGRELVGGSLTQHLRDRGPDLLDVCSDVLR
jgi:hypothetical protein